VFAYIVLVVNYQGEAGGPEHVDVSGCVARRQHFPWVISWREAITDRLAAFRHARSSLSGRRIEVLRWHLAGQAARVVHHSAAFAAAAEAITGDSRNGAPPAIAGAERYASDGQRLPPRCF
jgi:hypothetical protein